MNQEMNPMGQPKKKGMSKGCLVGLIVGIVLVVIVVGGGLVCWLKKDAIMKIGVVSMIEGIRTELNTNPVEGVDSVYINKVADAFLANLETDEVQIEQMAAVLQSLQTILVDKAVDAEEADQFIELMVDYYPELGELAPAEETMEDTSAVADSLDLTD
jgi:flagellar basal body-associated protein FliL